MLPSFAVSSLLLPLAVSAVGILGVSLKNKDSPVEIVTPRTLSHRNTIGVAVSLVSSEEGIYSAPAIVGNSSVSFVVSTRLADFVVVSTACRTQLCKQFEPTLYDAGESFHPLDNTTVQLFYGSEASCVIGQDSVTIGGLFVPNQTLASINNFNRSLLFNGSAGILGLGFPPTSKTALLGATSSLVSSDFGELLSVSSPDVPEAREMDGTDPSDSIAKILARLYAYGPIVPSLFIYGGINQPLFSLNFDRNFSGSAVAGLLTIGSLPTSVDSSSMTWVPVRLYENGTLPINWEVEIDAVFLDGKALPGSSQVPKVSVVVDTTATATGGPKDAIDIILDAISGPSPCNFSHTLSFQIGGKLFPVVSQDLLQAPIGNRRGCIANVEVIDALRSNWSQYTWRLGSSFLRSNLVAFDYGSLTHPSTEPPQMGFMSLAGIPSSNGAARWRGEVRLERWGWPALISVGLVMVFEILSVFN